MALTIGLAIGIALTVGAWVGLVVTVIHGRRVIDRLARTDPPETDAEPRIRRGRT